MKILLISSYLPYPLYSGGQVRLYNLIKELSQKHEITLICERRPTETESDVAEVAKICHELITVKRKKQWSLGNILQSSSSSHSFLVTGHTLPEMQRKIKECLDKSAFDLIHVETFYVMQNVPATSIPIVLVEHNIEYKVYERFKNNAPLLLQPLLAIDIAKIKKEEKACWKRAASVVAVSKDDQMVIQAVGLDAEIVSNGVNTEQFAFKNAQALSIQKNKKILFIGDFKWLQNKDSVTFIIKEVWPLIQEQMADGADSRIRKMQNEMKLWIVARKIPESIKRLTDDPDVLFDEKSSVKPTPKIFQEATVLLAPIRVGGGTSYKILESMSSGTPVVTMLLSANALEAKDAEELMIGNSAEELATKTVQLLKDQGLHDRMSKKGRAFIEKRYTWKEIARALDEVYRKSRR